MPLTIRAEKQHDALTLFCTGALIAESAPVLKLKVKEILPREKRLILDLAGVSRMDSAGLGVLVSLYVSARKTDCVFQLANMSAPIRDLLGVTHLLSVFESAGRFNSRMP